jgi:hypothetical protein
MYIVPGILFIVASWYFLAWARARDGKARPVLVRSEVTGGIVVIGIIVTFTIGVTLSIMQFTG